MNSELLLVQTLSLRAAKFTALIEAKYKKKVLKDGLIVSISLILFGLRSLSCTSNEQNNPCFHMLSRRT